ncbi:MAG: SWIB/MDM2 domain-containing proteins, partial [uncultured Gemmatimonadaceae bacterium]
EGDDAERGARRRGRHEPDAAHRGHEEGVGVHPQEQPAGRAEQAADQRRRQPAQGVRRQEERLDVRDDEARQPAPEV